MNIASSDRKINITKDVFLEVCQLLSMHAIISLIVTCKEYHNYEQYIWGIIQYQYFPKSLISRLNYKHIKTNIALDYYHCIKRKYHCISKIEKQIVGLELYIISLYDELKQFNKNILPDNTSILSIKEELAKTHYSIEDILNKTGIDDYRNFGLKQILITFKQHSIIDPTGVPYYTIKKDIDMALYGLDETDPNERKIGIKNNKWVTQVYDAHNDYQHNNYLLVRRISDICEDCYSPYRIHVKPDYIKNLETQYNILCVCGTVHDVKYNCGFYSWVSRYL
jgi:hypothetical protein